MSSNFVKEIFAKEGSVCYTAGELELNRLLMITCSELREGFSNQIKDKKWSKGVSYRTIALKAGVTERTVKNAANHPDLVRMETLEKIKNAVEAI